MSVRLFDRSRVGSVGSLLAAVGVLASAALGQPGTTEDPALKALERVEDRIHGPATLVVGEASETADAVAALGESPVSALMEQLGADVQLYTQHVVTLSNPYFEGRAPGLEGNRRAADYIEHHFRRAGLKPAFPTIVEAADGTEVRTPWSSYRQPFAAGRQQNVRSQRLAISVGGADPVELRADEEFSALSVSGSGEARSAVVFAGYSIADGRGGFSSYDGDDSLTGKIAMILRFEPMDERGRSRWADQGWSPAASLGAKIDAAVNLGASAVLLVNPPGADDPRANELMTVRTPLMGMRPSRVPVVMVSTEAADRIVRAADPEGRSLMDLRKLADRGGGAIELSKAAVSVGVQIAREPVMTDNVAGVLPGRGALADEYIVIGAHYDHAGYGQVGARPENVGQLHPGADDNASGTSGLLLLAEKLAEDYAALGADAEARSILFIGFSAEESGLVGSRHFVENPPIDRSRMYLMMNMDMIGRLRDGQLEVDGADSGVGMAEWVKPFLDASGLTIATSGRLGGRSDHASFLRRGIPVLMFFTGFHREYHQPSDVAWTINGVGAVRVVDLVHRIALAAAMRTEPLKFAGQERAENDRGGDQGAVPTALAPAGGQVRFGIAPGTYAEGAEGVVVGDVYEGTSAAEAGLKVGDRIVRWNGKALENVEAWMPLLQAHKPGDVVEIVFVRDGKEMTTKATLKARGAAGRQ